LTLEEAKDKNKKNREASLRSDGGNATPKQVETPRRNGWKQSPKYAVYMANRLKMEKVHAIIGLLEHGWSHRSIARELGIDRGTVSRYDRLRREGSKPAISTPGSDAPDTPNPAKATPGSSWGPKPAIPTPGTAPGRASLCEPFREVITGYLEAGLHGQRIWQDLRYEHGFTGSYSSVNGSSAGSAPLGLFPSAVYQQSPARRFRSTSAPAHGWSRARGGAVPMSFA